MKKQTKIISKQFDKENGRGFLNPPIYKGSTVIFETMEQFNHALANSYKEDYYGIRSNPIQRAFEEAICELDNAKYAITLPSGHAALAATLLGIVDSGDHVLICNGCYRPTTEIAQKFYAGMGVSCSWFPSDCQDISPYLQKNTKMIILETPATHSMELLDIPNIVKVAKEKNILTVLDNSWASGLFFKPLDMGIDISIIAISKFMSGHSDFLMGSVSTNDETLWQKIKDMTFMLGYNTSPEDIYLATRGIKTMPLRMKQSHEVALEMADFLYNLSEVDELLFPAHSKSPHYELWQRDFSGCASLMSVALNMNDEQVEKFVNALKIIPLGVSWGGFSSLVMRFDQLMKLRPLQERDYSKPHLRFYFGLEDTNDLKEDILQALQAAK